VHRTTRVEFQAGSKVKVNESAAADDQIPVNVESDVANHNHRMSAVDVGGWQIEILLHSAVDDVAVVSAANHSGYGSQAGGENEWRRHIVELKIGVVLEVSGLHSRLARDPGSISYRDASDRHGPAGTGAHR